MLRRILLASLVLIAAVTAYEIVTFPDVSSGSGLISGDQTAMFTTGIIGTALAVFFGVLSLPSIVAGTGLLTLHNWARVVAIVLGVLHLFGFPIGTAIGVYTLYVLLNDKTAPLFASPAPRPA